MAKNKKSENTLTYLQMPLPQGRKYSKMTKVTFGGLNRRYTLDSGDLSMEKDISTSEYPYLVPSELKKPLFSGYSHPISMFAFDYFIVVVYRENTAIKIDYISRYDNSDSHRKLTSTLKTFETEEEAKEDEIPRSIVQFNVFESGETLALGDFKKRLLIFPDKKSMFFDVEDLTNSDEMEKIPEDSDDEFVIYDMDDAENAIITPPIKYATVHVSRVFGVSDDCVFASGFNDYTNWALDTSDDGLGDSGYDEKNAWMSQTQSNTKADGNFTGIINFQGHVVCFKRDYMHEIYNTKNPFRIQDIYAEGAIDNRSIQDVDGKLIFVSEDDVKIYTGSNPRIIGYNLNMPQYAYAVSGTDNRNYYLYCEDNKDNKHLYVYDTYTELWSEQSIDSRVLNFAHNKYGMYMLCTDSNVYKMDTGEYSQDWCFETDLITNKTVDIKHIKKLQMLVEADKDSSVEVYILYDDKEFSKNSHLVYSSRGKTGKFPIRVKPRNTANYGFKLHIKGKGYVKLYELEMFVEAGGDLYV